MEHGNAILASVLVPAGFTLEEMTAGRGSGGSFARSRWTKDSQAIELHVRAALGVVRYCWDQEAFDHKHLVEALAARAKYPGFSDDPLDGFRHLAQDLSESPLSQILKSNHHKALSAARNWQPPKRALP